MQEWAVKVASASLTGVLGWTGRLDTGQGWSPTGKTPGDLGHISSTAQGHQGRLATRGAGRAKNSSCRSPQGGRGPVDALAQARAPRTVGQHMPVLGSANLVVTCNGSLGTLTGLG